MQTLPSESRHIVLFGPSFGEGGVARDIVNLANGFVRAGMEVSVLVNRPNELFTEQLYPQVRLVVLPSRSDRGLARELLAFIRAHWPDVVLTTEERDDGIAVAVREELGDARVRFFLRMVTTLSVRLANQYRFRLNRALYRRRLRQIYSHCDGVICNSEGVADDLVAFLDLPRDAIAVLPNPTITPELLAAAQEPIGHPWFAPGEPPVILGAGRLGRAKDFGTLLKAFASLRGNRPCRLMILGQGRQRERLEAQARELGAEADFELPGFVTNPYAYMARAGLFVLSSLWEGCPNVLIEAMAVGTPVVATDCRSGPREILQGGRFGPLVPMRDAEAMAEAMAATLDHPLPPAVLREAVRGYTVENSIRMHLETFFP
ncbi:glycosyltransferase [Methylococcus sp. Mc7]|uniref:glycosyltransferase n=1 Tax=Methylococcus sp. Mc7 TaxID=2860258 RepID=UPI001C52E078|nr:glycosyltransferase [Methylococcus sp. Mc7]QXP84815.1 glycosyltransferase [Methylococcus sp. Mc7]